MSKQIFILIAIVGLVVFIGFWAVAGVDGGGSVSDPDYYCRALLKGDLFGDNLKLESLDCSGRPYPASLVARLIGGDDNVICQASVDNNAYGEEAKIGDLGATEQRYYNFKLSNVAEGSHNINVRCQGESHSVEKSFKIEVIS